MKLFTQLRASAEAQLAGFYRNRLETALCHNVEELALWQSVESEFLGAETETGKVFLKLVSLPVFDLLNFDQQVSTAQNVCDLLISVYSEEVSFVVFHEEEDRDITVVVLSDEVEREALQIFLEDLNDEDLSFEHEEEDEEEREEEEDEGDEDEDEESPGLDQDLHDEVMRDVLGERVQLVPQIEQGTVTGGADSFEEEEPDSFEEEEENPESFEVEPTAEIPSLEDIEDESEIEVEPQPEPEPEIEVEPQPAAKPLSAENIADEEVAMAIAQKYEEVLSMVPADAAAQMLPEGQGVEILMQRPSKKNEGETVDYDLRVTVDYEPFMNSPKKIFVYRVYGLSEGEVVRMVNPAVLRNALENL